jgi:hypothetical protein
VGADGETLGEEAGALTGGGVAQGIGGSSTHQRGGGRSIMRSVGWAVRGCVKSSSAGSVGQAAQLRAWGSRA